MATRVSLQAALRTALGRNQVKKQRSLGRVPAVVYGSGKARSIEIEGVKLLEVLKSAESENILVDLSVAGENGKDDTCLALLSDMQVHPLKDRVLHVDFRIVNEKKPIEVDVPVMELGEAPGVKMGGLLDHLVRKVRVSCLPKDLPNHIDGDISSLNVGDMIYVKDLKVPEGVTVHNPADLPVFVVHASRTSISAAAAAQAAPDGGKGK